MTRFAIAAALATALGLSFAGTADAQYVQRYTTITPNGGIVTGGNAYNFGTYQSYRNYVSPYGTVKQQNYYGDIYGNSYGQSSGYNTFNGYGYNRGFYQPSPFVVPYGGYNYNFYGRRY